MKRDGKGKAFILLGALLLLGAASLTGYNLYDAHRAEEASNHITRIVFEKMMDEVVRETEEIPVVRVEENDCMGILEIPSRDLTLPVMAQWDYEKLKISPCRFSGSCEKKNLVICAHNYPSHFGSIRNLSPGEDVYLTTADRTVYHYLVSGLETLLPDRVDEMTGLEDETWDLTLFTCSLSGQTRCAVRCVLASES